MQVDLSNTCSTIVWHLTLMSTYILVISVSLFDINCVFPCISVFQMFIPDFALERFVCHIEMLTNV